MAQKFKLNLDALCAENERIGEHLAAARDSMTEGGSYKLKLNGVRDCHRRMGDIISDAFDSMAPRGGEAAPRGAADRAPCATAEIPGINRLMNQTL